MNFYNADSVIDWSAGRSGIIARRSPSELESGLLSRHLSKSSIWRVAERKEWRLFYIMWQHSHGSPLQTNNRGETKKRRDNDEEYLEANRRCTFCIYRKKSLRNITPVKLYVFILHHNHSYKISRSFKHVAEGSDAIVANLSLKKNGHERHAHCQRKEYVWFFPVCCHSFLKIISSYNSWTLKEEGCQYMA